MGLATWDETYFLLLTSLILLASLLLLVSRDPCLCWRSCSFFANAYRCLQCCFSPSHIWLNICVFSHKLGNPSSSHICIYDFATDPIRISLFMRKISFFLLVKTGSLLYWRSVPNKNPTIKAGGRRATTTEKAACGRQLARMTTEVVRHEREISNAGR
jgi:hypothetical protein